MKRIAFLPLALVLLLPLPAVAQTGSLVGFVRDGDIYAGANIPDATVTLSDGRQATTGPDGKYAFDDVPAGAVTVTAAAAGFQTRTETKTLVAGVVNWKSLALVRACEASCDGLACGDDGCGGSCGQCKAGASCEAGACECAPASYQGCCGSAVCWFDSCGLPGAVVEACAWGCSAGACLPCQPACGARECGEDGCGGTCGACGGLETCLAGTCGCEPEDHKACCGNAVCWIDGCGKAGAKVADCAGGCADGACLSCTPSCGTATCGDDGCGGSCGECDGGRACRSGKCVCLPLDHTGCCGTETCWFDSCDNAMDTIDFCANGCADGACRDCAPQCEALGRQCGDDGCGGSCGACPEGTTCEAGLCACNAHDHKGCCGNAVCWFNSCDAPEAEVQPCLFGCSEGRCNDCQPRCEGIACGDDGCGGTCPDRCDPGYRCTEAGCRPVPAEVGSPWTPTGDDPAVTPEGGEPPAGSVVIQPGSRADGASFVVETGACSASPAGAGVGFGLMLAGILLGLARRRG
jgi:hypothetical protein